MCRCARSTCSRRSRCRCHDRTGRLPRRRLNAILRRLRGAARAARAAGGPAGAAVRLGGDRRASGPARLGRVPGRARVPSPPSRPPGHRRQRRRASRCRDAGGLAGRRRAGCRLGSRRGGGAQRRAGSASASAGCSSTRRRPGANWTTSCSGRLRAAAERWCASCLRFPRSRRRESSSPARPRLRPCLSRCSHRAASSSRPRPSPTSRP